MYKISVFGLGYVGCVSVGCLAEAGHHIVGVDTSAAKADLINSGKPTIIEQGIDHLIAQQFAAGKVSATTKGIEAVSQTDISIISVGTPPTTNGHLDLSAILNVAGEIGRGLKEKKSRHVIAIRSTVLPGTSEQIEKVIAQASGKKNGEDFAVVSNPEFLREGTAIDDFRHPSFTLVGSGASWGTEMMKEVYAGLNAPFVVTAPRIAEMMKYVCNTYHALKITFANEVGNICQAADIDAQELMRIFCLDTKLNISAAYLRPGFAYGGSCLPKDLRALQMIAHDKYLSCPVLENVQKSNEQQKEMVCRDIQRIGKQNVGFIGISFKAGTDDLRESPIVDVIERLLGKGYNVRIYDKCVHLSKLVGANKDYILQKIPYIARFITDDLASVLDHSELIVIVNNESGLKESLMKVATSKAIYDLANLGFGKPLPK